MYDPSDRTYKQCAAPVEGTCSKWGAACAPQSACMFDPGDGLLPCLAGEINEFYLRPDARGRGTGRRLARAAVDWLRARDVWTVRNLVCAEDRAAQGFWRSLGFAPDMVCLSLYRSD